METGWKFDQPRLARGYVVIARGGIAFLQFAELLGALEKYIHRKDDLPVLVRAGLLHVQFETLHPYLDGNGRIGRLLITLLLEHWNVLSHPLPLLT